MDSTNRTDTTEATDAGKAKGHRHAALMAEFARDAAVMDRPWEAWECRMGDGYEWEVLWDCPLWRDCEYEYRRKPRTIRIGGMDVPEPVREPLERGTWYWVPALGASDYVGNWVYGLAWSGDVFDLRALARGLVHRTAEAAATHARALVALTEGKV